MFLSKADERRNGWLVLINQKLCYIFSCSLSLARNQLAKVLFLFQNMNLFLASRIWMKMFSYCCSSIVSLNLKFWDADFLAQSNELERFVYSTSTVKSQMYLLCVHYTRIDEIWNWNGNKLVVFSYFVRILSIHNTLKFLYQKSESLKNCILFTNT